MISCSVNAEDGEANLFGKTVNELQENLVIGEYAITGTLNYVSGYTGFSSVISEQAGNYLALRIDTDEPEALTTVELVGGTKGPVVLDDDMNIVLLIKDKNSQSIKVTMETDEDSLTKTYDLSGLTLETE